MVGVKWVQDTAGIRLPLVKNDRLMHNITLQSGEGELFCVFNV